MPAGGSTDVVLRSAALTARQKLSETEDENAAVEGARHLELNAERVARLRQKSVRAVRNRRTVRNRRMEKRRDKAQVTLLYREALEKDEKLKSSSILKNRYRSSGSNGNTQKSKELSSLWEQLLSERLTI